MELDIENRQLVGMNGDDIVILRPQERMTKEEAIAHAAWLVAIADDSDRNDRFNRTLWIIQNG